MNVTMALTWVKKKKSRYLLVGTVFWMLMSFGPVSNMIGLSRELLSDSWVRLGYTAFEPTWHTASLFELNASSPRSDRFPSVKERTMFYMSSWYAPPCVSDDKKIRSYAISKRIGTEKFAPYYVRGIKQLDLLKSVVRSGFLLPYPTADHIFALDPTQLEGCMKPFVNFTTGNATVILDSMAESYCPELRNSVLSKWNSSLDIPLLVQTGDQQRSIITNEDIDKSSDFSSIPHLSKTRPAWDDSDWSSLDPFESACGGRVLSDGLIPPIIWKLNRRRHYGDLPLVPKKDIPWGMKTNKAVFRGRPTGFDRLKSGVDLCDSSPRCRVSRMYAGSSLVDSKIVMGTGAVPLSRLPSEVVGEPLDMREMLTCKALLVIQGNDVATGLKWAMLSNSVVIMPKPTISSWFMEEWLVPWVHYVPIRADLTDVETQMQWIIDNDAEARQIALRSTLWVRDMLYHEDAAKDENAIEEEILARYLGLYEEPVDEEDEDAEYEEEDVEDEEEQAEES